MTAIIVILMIIAVLSVLLALYLFVFMRPRAKAPSDRRLITDYAHRGLHCEGVPENSLAAFERALQNGCGIELDVQLSRDGEIMVFHDYTLERMTGKKGKFCKFTAAELRELVLGDTEEHIPTLAEVLRLVDGRVPLLVELKGESLNSSICAPVAKMLSQYNGAYCLESFNPILLRKMAKLMPNVWRGLLYTNVVRDKKRILPLDLVLTAMLQNIIARPNFIAFKHIHRRTLSVRICRRLWNVPQFCWTIREKQDYILAKENGECAIFEGFTP